jgi:hypothetical protein
MIRVRLTKNLVSILDGVDISMLNVGEILELPDSSAALLIAEKWAEPIADPVPEPVVDLIDEPVDEPVMTYLLLETSDGQRDFLN